MIADALQAEEEVFAPVYRQQPVVWTTTRPAQSAYRINTYHGCVHVSKAAYAGWLCATHVTWAFAPCQQKGKLPGLLNCVSSWRAHDRHLFWHLSMHA